MLTFKIADSEIDMKLCRSIREQVFINEQNVSPDIEMDDLDCVATHFLAFLDDIPVGTARLVKINNKCGKISRVAVLKEHRGKNIGKLLMQTVINYAKDNKISSLLLGSQVHAMDFYKKLGFSPYGNMFIEADIEHYMMRLDLK